jgi:peptidoglycan/LPS O-acetylase OafA/YrhL
VRPAVPTREDGQEIRSLTGLRGVAACVVMAYHFSTGWVLPEPAQTMLRHGYLAVDLFFVLSGFVMALTYGARFRTAARGVYADFLVRRLGRIYPLYIVAAIVAVSFGLQESYVRLSAAGLLANGLLIQTWGLADCYLGPAWSLSTELGAYVVFPVLVRLALRRASVAACAGLAACLLLVFLATRSTPTLHQVIDGEEWRAGPLDVFGPFTLYPLLRCLAAFTLGMLAFRAARSRRFARPAATETAGILSAVLVLALMMAPDADIAIVLSFVALIIALASSTSIVARLLASRVPYWLGLVSYSIYLLHVLVERSARDTISAALHAAHVPHAAGLTMLALCGVSIALAAASYALIEKPGRELVRALLARRVAMAAAR